MQIVHISAECFPIAKVGGLADVVGALPKYQEASGHSSKVIMPFYDNKFTQANKEAISVAFGGKIMLGPHEFQYSILEVDKKILGFEVFMVKIKGLTDRANVYSYGDDVERFMAFQIVACDFIQGFHQKPDIVHCHDHHTGFVPFFMGYAHRYQELRNIPTIVTIHNAQYQGDFEYDIMHYLPSFDMEHAGLIDWYGRINPLAAAVKCAWKVTTVSPNYLSELQYNANGLEGLLQNETQKSLGILNGVDTEVWNPETDPMLVSNYGLKEVLKGRAANKKWLCDQFNFNPKLPLIAFIGRFVYEKGADLLADTVYNVLANQQQKVNILIQGSGNLGIEHHLNSLRDKFVGNYNTYIGYDEKLAHIVYGGADFLLMPSRVEPCGLNQMYAMRYGMFPIVSNTGGLKDTVIDIDLGETGYGIVMNEVTVDAISFAIQRAKDVYKNQKLYKAKQKQLMKIENSWHKSAQEYTNMYEILIKNAKK